MTHSLPAPEGPAPDFHSIAQRKRRTRALVRSTVSITVGIAGTIVAVLWGMFADAATADALSGTPIMHHRMLSAATVRAVMFAWAGLTAIGLIGDVRNLASRLGRVRTGRLLSYTTVTVSYLVVAAAVAVLAQWTNGFASLLGTTPDVAKGIAVSYIAVSLLGGVSEWRCLARIWANVARGADVDLEISEREADINEILSDAGIQATGPDGVYELAEQLWQATHDDGALEVYDESLARLNTDLAALDQPHDSEPAPGMVSA